MSILHLALIHVFPKDSGGNTIENGSKLVLWESSGLVVECLTRHRGTAGSSLTGVTVLWSVSKTHLSLLSTGSTQEDPDLFN